MASISPSEKFKINKLILGCHYNKTHSRRNGDANFVVWIYKESENMTSKALSCVCDWRTNTIQETWTFGYFVFMKSCWTKPSLIQRKLINLQDICKRRLEGEPNTEPIIFREVCHPIICYIQFPSTRLILFTWVCVFRRDMVTTFATKRGWWTNHLKRWRGNYWRKIH